jgi:hypothetical protein
MCSLSVTVPWWRSLGGRLCLQQVPTRRDTVLVMTTQVSAACFVFSPMWLRMVVCCVMCICSCFGVCSCVGVCFIPLCTNATSSYMTWRCSCFNFKKIMELEHVGPLGKRKA